MNTHTEGEVTESEEIALGRIVVCPPYGLLIGNSGGE